jgi:hypothetical protein
MNQDFGPIARPVFLNALKEHPLLLIQVGHILLPLSASCRWTRTHLSPKPRPKVAMPLGLPCQSFLCALSGANL